MASGTVKTWNGRTGFIRDDAGGADLFFGDRGLAGISADQIRTGMRVEFDAGEGPKGRRADRVRPAGGAVPVDSGRGSQRPASPRANQPAAAVRGTDGGQRSQHRDQSPAAALDLQQSASTAWTLPRATQKVIRGVRVEDRHPLIQLDRLSLPGDQKVQRASLDDVVRTSGDPRLLAELDARRRKLLATQSPADRIAVWNQKTDGPLTLHLARSGILENAGLALHPVYGFAYLPGSGLKGMARAAAQELLGYSPEKILSIFGNEPGEGREGYQRAGEIIFHEAWPVSWPRLMIDIVNNHHPTYYQGKDAPGDWDAPNPVYFLAVAPGTEFGFALSMRRCDGDTALLHAAVTALQQALSLAGAGAKTAAGYGGFEPPADVSVSADTDTFTTDAESIKPPRPERWKLRLESPAFLAGAEQALEDCDLRSATLRGQLRAWWRKLHAGYVTVDELRQLEATVWGDTVQGSPIRIRLRTIKRPQVRLHEHPKDRFSGLKYLAYGMDETSRGVRKQRAVADTNGQWELACLIRPSHYVAAGQKKKSESGQPIEAEQIRLQFHAALWLLTHFGGVGSKGRKGFGSPLAEGQLEITRLDQAMEAAAGLRRSLGMTQTFQESLAESPALGHPDKLVSEQTIAARDGWEAIEIAGKAYASVASSFKHQEGKIALGLPRKIHGPMDKPLRHQNEANHQRPQFLKTAKQSSGKPQDARYAAPVHLHVTQAEPGRWVVRLLALPVKYLPDAASHRTTAEFLKEFVGRFEQEIRVGSVSTPKPNTGGGGSTGGGGRAPQGPPRVVQGFAQVQVTVLEIKQVGNRQQLKVQEADKPKPGMLIDGTPPDPLPEVGQQVTAYRSTTSDINSPRYRWTLPEPKQQQGGQRRGGRR
ncbi:MAG: type III-B CRISPR module RAMP protein Cmr6 [Planctomycetaceae bacterium]|nr:MAG: type III-B CRISPR module RAMP protein Cmr6 [Planctomycetaceae bacterium]